LVETNRHASEEKKFRRALVQRPPEKRGLSLFGNAKKGPQRPPKAEKGADVLICEEKKKRNIRWGEKLMRRISS